MSDASMPHCPHCNEPEYACDCPASDKMTDEDIDAEILAKEEAKDRDPGVLVGKSDEEIDQMIDDAKPMEKP